MPKLKISLVLVLLSVLNVVYSQDSISVKITADVVNRYVTRGQNSGGESAQIQPLLSASFKNLEIGAWGTYGISNDYHEIDVYAKYTINNFAIQFMHYATIKDGDGEIVLYYKPIKSIPLTISTATYVYGCEKYSNYSEIGYTINIGTQPVELFTGFTPYKGIYNSFRNSFDVVNVGATFRKSMLNIPTYITFCGNPQSKELFFIFGLTL